MILKDSLIYFLFRLVPAASSLMIIAFYTRYLTTAEYGLYSFTFFVASGVNSLLFGWINISVGRYYPECKCFTEKIEIISLAFFIFLLPAFFLVLFSLMLFVFSGNLVIHGVHIVIALPITVAIGWFDLIQRIQNADFRPVSYGITLTLKSFLTLFIGGMGIYYFDWSSSEILVTLFFSYFLSTFLSYRYIFDVRLECFSPQNVLMFLKYGLPLTMTLFMVFILNGSSRFFLNKYVGLSAVGSFSASYDLVQYSVGTLVSVVSLCGFPAIVKAYSISLKNGENVSLEYFHLLMILLVPIIFGIISIKTELSNLFIGKDFRSDAEHLIPIISFVLLLNVLKSAYFDYAFQLIKKTFWQLFISVISAMSAIVFNMFLIKRIGILGAAYAGVLAFGLYLVLTIILGRKMFKMPIINVMSIAKICISGCIMFLILSLVCFDQLYLSLIVKVLLGVIIYGGLIVILNVNNVRSKLFIVH